MLQGGNLIQTGQPAAGLGPATLSSGSAKCTQRWFDTFGPASTQPDVLFLNSSSCQPGCATGRGAVGGAAGEPTAAAARASPSQQAGQSFSKDISQGGSRQSRSQSARRQPVCSESESNLVAPDKQSA